MPNFGGGAAQGYLNYVKEQGERDRTAVLLKAYLEGQDREKLRFGQEQDAYKGALRARSLAADFLTTPPSNVSRETGAGPLLLPEEHTDQMAPTATPAPQPPAPGQQLGPSIPAAPAAAPAASEAATNPSWQSMPQVPEQAPHGESSMPQVPKPPVSAAGTAAAFTPAQDFAAVLAKKGVPKEDIFGALMLIQPIMNASDKKRLEMMKFQLEQEKSLREAAERTRTDATSRANNQYTADTRARTAEADRAERQRQWDNMSTAQKAQLAVSQQNAGNTALTTQYNTGTSVGTPQGAIAPPPQAPAPSAGTTPQTFPRVDPAVQGQRNQEQIALLQRELVQPVNSNPGDQARIRAEIAKLSGGSPFTPAGGDPLPPASATGSSLTTPPSSVIAPPQSQRERDRIARDAAKNQANQKPMPVNAAKGLFENQTNLRRAESALALIQGKDLGEMKGDKNATGFKGFLPDAALQRVDPKGVDARAAIADLGSLVIHDRSGAAVTAAEFPRLTPFIPSSRDDPATVEKKLKRFVQVYKQEVDATRDYYESAGFRVPAVSSTSQAPAPKSAPAAAPTGKIKFLGFE